MFGGGQLYIAAIYRGCYCFPYTKLLYCNLYRLPSYNISASVKVWGEFMEIHTTVNNNVMLAVHLAVLLVASPLLAVGQEIPCEFPAIGQD